MIEYVSIKIKKPVHSELVSLGSYGESMNDVIAKCVKAFKERNRK